MFYPDFYHGDKITSWDELKKNVGFVIFKATQGVVFTSPKMQEYIRECEARKIPYWLYFFLNKGDELAQTRFGVKTAKKYIGEMFQGFCLDVEMGNGAGGVKTALDWLKENSVTGKCMIYTMHAQYDKYKDVIKDRGESCAWWEARYGKNDGEHNSAYPCHKGVDLHQYTSKGVCPGIKNKCDLSALTGTLPEEWFTGKTIKVDPVAETYPGEYPELSLQRGYYKNGDGISTYKNKAFDIKRVQELVNWATGAGLAVDGKYGDKTENAVKKFQGILGVEPDGLFGEKTLEAAKNYKR